MNRKDIFQYICLFLKEKDLLSLKRTSKTFKKFVDSIIEIREKKNLFSEKEKYLYGKFLSIKTLDLKYFGEACFSKSLFFVKQMIKNGANDFDKGLIEACGGGSFQIVHLMIYYGAKSFGKGIINAAKHGNLDIVMFLFNKNLLDEDSYYLAYNAAKYNHIKIIEFLCDNNCDINPCLVGACRSGNNKLKQQMINLGANDFFISALAACKGGHIEIFKEMHKKEEFIEKRLLMEAACEGGNYEMIKYLSIENPTYSGGLEGACLKGNIELINFLVEKGAKGFNRGLRKACRGNKVEAAKLMLSLGEDLDLDSAFYSACLNNSNECAFLMVKEGATDFEEGFKEACLLGNFELVKFLIKTDINAIGDKLDILSYETSNEIAIFLDDKLL